MYDYVSGEVLSGGEIAYLAFVILALIAIVWYLVRWSAS